MHCFMKKLVERKVVLDDNSASDGTEVFHNLSKDIFEKKCINKQNKITDDTVTSSKKGYDFKSDTSNT